MLSTASQLIRPAYIHQLKLCDVIVQCRRLLALCDVAGQYSSSNILAAGPRCFASEATGKKDAAAPNANTLDASVVSAASHDGASPTQHSQGIDPALHADAVPSSNSTPASNSASILQKYISQELVTDVSSTINRLTGYEGIDRLKARVATVDEALTDCKRELQAAKLLYDQYLSKQTQLHREVTALLQRKSSWVPADVSRFTELYAAEHETETAVAAAKARYTQLGDDVELLQLKMVDLIRERYQQEQAWSDKIRRASTWWTWGLMGLHFASFMAVYTFIEPRKRAALTTAVSSMLQQHTASIDGKLAALADAVPAVTAQAVSDTQQQQQQERAVKQQLGVTVGTAGGASSSDVQQQVLQELQKMQQQLQALSQRQQQPDDGAQRPSSSSSSSSSKSGFWWQLPSRQWIIHQASTVTSAAAHSWQAVKTRGLELPSLFNPMQTLGREPGAAPVDPVEGSSAGSQGTTTATGVTITSSSSSPSRSEASSAKQHLQPAPTQQQSVDATQQQQAKQTAANAGASQPAVQQQMAAGGSNNSSIRGLFARLKRGDAVEVTPGQLAVLSAAASTCGAAVGALLMLLLRS